jgi:hypothetical protein
MNDAWLVPVFVWRLGSRGNAECSARPRSAKLNFPLQHRKATAMTSFDIAGDISERQPLSVTLTKSGCERSWQLRRDSYGWTYRVAWPGHVIAGGLPDPHSAKSKAQQFLEEIRNAQQEGWH